MSTEPARAHRLATAARRARRAGRTTHGRDTQAHDYELPELPESVDIFDTIAAATGASRRGCRSPWTTSSGWPSNSTIWASRYIEGGWPGANPKDD